MRRWEEAGLESNHLISNGDAHRTAWFLAFPALLLLYYLICWLMFGNHQKIHDVAPQYEPPSGVSPGVARYILTGGSDGTTLAAILAQLAAQGVVAIDPQADGYRVTLLKKDTEVCAEEAAVIQSLLHVPLPVLASAVSKPAKNFVVMQGGNLRQGSAGLNIENWNPQPLDEAVINPKLQPQIAAVLNQVQQAFRENLEGVYFRWHWGCAGIGLMATFLWAMVNAVLLQSGRAPSVFLTVWLFFFSSIAGLVFSGARGAGPVGPCQYAAT